MNTWLGETRQLDLSHPKLRITAQKLTQCRQTLPARAAAIHGFVRRMPFAAAHGRVRASASEILLSAQGDCHAKGLLFVALCRAAGLPARLRFLRVRAGLLAGILEFAPETINVAVGEVHVGTAWVSTDSYVADPVMFAHAKMSLRAHDMDSGWGIVLPARGRWDGRGDCINQFEADDVVESLGTFDDVDAFHRAHPFAGGWMWSLKYAIGAGIVNRSISRLRAARFSDEVSSPGAGQTYGT